MGCLLRPCPSCPFFGPPPASQYSPSSLASAVLASWLRTGLLLPRALLLLLYYLQPLISDPTLRHGLSLDGSFLSKPFLICPPSLGLVGAGMKMGAWILQHDTSPYSVPPTAPRVQTPKLPWPCLLPEHWPLTVPAWLWSLLIATISPGPLFPSDPGARNGGWPGFAGLFPETCHLLPALVTCLLFLLLTPEVRWEREGRLPLPGTQDSRTFLDGHGVKLDHERLLFPSHSGGWNLLSSSNL